MKTSNDLTFVGNHRGAKFHLFLMTILINFFAGCNTEEIAPVSVHSQRSLLEAPLENDTEETALRRRPITSIEVFCDWLQARAKGLLDEYKDPSLSDKRRREILTELREIGDNWKVAGCQTIFGDITKLFPKKPLTPLKAAPTGGTVLK